MKVRRVVTGHTPDGGATIASDQEVDALTVALAPGAEFHRLWGADEAPTFPDEGAPPPHRAYFPPIGGGGSVWPCTGRGSGPGCSSWRWRTPPTAPAALSCCCTM